MRRERLTQENLGDSHHIEDYQICNHDELPHLEKNIGAKYERLVAPILDYEGPEEKEDVIEAIGSKIIDSIMRQADDYGRKRNFDSADTIT